MIQGKKKSIELRTEEILQKITHYDIYRYYVGHFTLGRPIHAPYRRDRDPSFCIRVSQAGDVYHIDYTTNMKGDSFKYLMQVYGLTLQEALHKINLDFGLGLADAPKKDYQQVISAYQAPKLVKRYVKITVITRRFTREELAYWNQYGLSSDDLKASQVYGIDKVYMNRKLVPNYGNKLRFGYYFEPNWKIYTPYAEQRQDKFYPSNVPGDRMEDLHRLEGTQKGIITKSRKDKMVLQKLYGAVAATQNESPAAINEENLSFIQAHCARPYIGFDNDRAGKEAAQYYVGEYGFQSLAVPDPYFERGITDFADLARAEGLEKVKALLEQNHILS
jgi:DNA primase